MSREPRRVTTLGDAPGEIEFAKEEADSEDGSARLTIELVPSSSWGNNLRSMLTTDEWDALRRESYRTADYRCEVCGGKGPSHPVECHEIWEYDDEAHVQKLIGLQSLCPACHEVKHIGRAGAMGRFREALAHLMKTNGWSRETATGYLNDVSTTHEHRSQYDWKVDIDFAKKAREAV